MRFGKMVALLPALVAVGAAVPARADVTAEALLKVLVRKGVLTQQEADAVKAEAANEPIAPPKAAPAAETAALQAAVKTLQRTSITGYMQFRAVSQKYARPSTQFMDRRARLSVRNTTDTGRFVVTLEGAPTAVGLYDGYYDWFVKPATASARFTTLRVGQFGKPFGMEMETSPADLELPELPVGWGVLFPCYRDVGMVAQVGVDRATRFDFAVLNGNGAGSVNFTNRDNDNYKDLSGRVRHTFRNVGDVALSAYRGRNTSAGTGGAETVTGDRNRWGVAAVFPNVGGGQLRTEYIGARDLTTNLGAGHRLGTADARAWQATYVHSVAPKTKVALRYDSWDPDTHDTYRLGGDGETNTFGVAGVHQVTDQLRLTLSVERPRIRRWQAASGTAPARAEDVLTFQTQYRF